MDMFPDISTLKNRDDVMEQFEVIETVSNDITSIFDAILKEAASDGDTDIISALARAGSAHVFQMQAASIAVNEYCFAADMAYEAFEKASASLANLQDTDEGRALRDLSRDLAGLIANITRPAFKAITEMQNQAAEIDAMVQRARDMAGCLRWLHSPDRDPERPEFSSLAHTVGEAMDPRTIAFAAAVHRARARQDAAATDAA